MLPRVAPDLSMETYWYYINAHHIDQTWSVRACGVRQRHVDQAQSMNYHQRIYNASGAQSLSQGMGVRRKDGLLCALKIT